MNDTNNLMSVMLINVQPIGSRTGDEYNLLIVEKKHKLFSDYLTFYYKKVEN